MGGSGVVGDGRLWRDRTREARRPAWRKRRKDSRYRPPQGAERASESRLHAGVRALIVAMKPGNAGGARRGAGRWRRGVWSMPKDTDKIAFRARNAGEGPDADESRTNRGSGR